MEWQSNVVDNVNYLTFGLFTIRENKNSFSIWHKGHFSLTVYDTESAKKICELAVNSVIEYEKRKDPRKSKINIKAKTFYPEKIEHESKQYLIDKIAKEKAEKEFAFNEAI